MTDLKRTITLLILTVLVSATAGIRAVDLTSLEVDVKMHPAEYRALLERFEQADTTLTSEELQKVYFGYSFTTDYDPSETFPEVEKAYEAADYEQSLKLAEEALRLNPVSLDLNVIALASADRMRDNGTMGEKILHYGIRADLVATAILESGKGTDSHTPFRVIASGDMTRLLRNVLCVEQIVDRTKVGDIDAIKVTFPGNDRRHILYFDTTRELQYFKAHPIR